MEPLRIVLNALGEEVAYVLKEHRDQDGRPLPGAPVFYYRPLSLDEQAEIEDDLVRARVGTGKDEEEPEMRVLSGSQERRVLLHNLMRIEGLSARSAAGAEYEVELPEPKRHGGARWNGDSPERRFVLNMLRREWRREIGRAILDNARLPEEAVKN